MSGDIVNALFEFGAALVLLLHINAILKAKRVVGVSIVPIVFYSCWGAWNLIYYPSLGQTWSFVAGVGVFAVNTAHVALMAYYRLYPGGRGPTCSAERSRD